MSRPFYVTRQELDAIPLHPGLRIREYIRSNGMTVTEAAELLRISRPALSNVVNGNAAISVSLALKMERAGWVRAEASVLQQAKYDLDMARYRTGQKGEA